MVWLPWRMVWTMLCIAADKRGVAHMVWCSQMVCSAAETAYGAAETACGVAKMVCSEMA